MPSSFPRVDLPSSACLDHVFEQVRSHSIDLLRAQLDRDGLRGDEEEAVCAKVIAKWLDDAKDRLRKGNVTIQGVGWKEWTAQSKALAPLDAQLATRIANLSRTADELTEDAVAYRRELPTRMAEAVRARDEVLDDVDRRLTEDRERVKRAGSAVVGDGDGDGDEGKAALSRLPEGLQSRPEDVARSLSTALAQADALAQAMPAHVAALEEQKDLVTQLRSMPP